MHSRPDETSDAETDGVEASADDWRKATALALAGVFGLALCAALWAAQAVFIPIVLAILISYALAPMQRLLQRARVPAPLAAAVVLVVTCGALGGAAYGMRGQANAFLATLPEAARRFRAELQQARGTPTAVTQVAQAAHEIARASSDSTSSSTPPPGVTHVQVESAPFRATDLIWKGTGSVLTLAGQALVVIVLVFYFLASGDRYKRKLVRIAGTTLSEKRLTVEILNEIETNIGRYLATRLLISIIVAAATWGAFWWLGMPEPAVWGLAAGVLNVIPYLGPIAFSATAAIVAFLYFGTLSHAIIVGTAASAIGVIEGFGITPVLMGRAGRMNGLIVFVALTFWGFLWGLWGLLLAVPMMMMIKVICDHVEGLSDVSEILGE